MNAASLSRSLGDSLIGQRRARSLAEARQRTQMIDRLRLALIVLISAAILNVVIQILISNLGGGEEPVLAFSGGERIVNPRFSGRDEAGQPFTVTATTATRRDVGVGIADLEAPTLDYALLQADGTDQSRVLARNGVFDEYNRTLLLQDQVRLSTVSGYKMTTRSALIALEDGQISGQDGVYADAPWGAFRADQFVISQDGRHIALSGNVRTRFTFDESQPNSGRLNAQD